MSTIYESFKRRFLDIQCATMGGRIALVRKVLGLSQEELALKAGISRITMGKLERNIGSTTLKTLLKVASALGVEPEDLIADE